MSSTARSATTLAVLCLLVVVATLWGWLALTEPLPEAQETPPCIDTSVTKGERVTTEDVLVSVFNGSTRQGLASATLAEFTNRGFLPGDTGNAPERLPQDSGVQILSSETDNPAVRLVQAQFPGAQVVEGDQLGDGVVVVMGNAFTAMTEPPVSSVKSGVDTTYCQATGVTAEE